MIVVKVDDDVQNSYDILPIKENNTQHKKYIECLMCDKTVSIFILTYFTDMYGLYRYGAVCVDCNNLILLKKIKQ